MIKFKRLLSLAFVIGAFLRLSACAAVKPYEGEYLSMKIMDFKPRPVRKPANATGSKRSKAVAAEPAAPVVAVHAIRTFWRNQCGVNCAQR